MEFPNIKTFIGMQLVVLNEVPKKNKLGSSSALIMAMAVATLCVNKL